MNSPVHYTRHIEPRIANALADTPVTLLAGPRQAGKTTLVRKIAAHHGLRYLTLDDAVTRLAANEDPTGLIQSLDRAVIDEIQRSPQLLLAIKKSVDEDRRPGRFLLTGSANLMALPSVADSLAGRMETLTLLPLSQSEIEGRPKNWIDTLFAGQAPQVSGSNSGLPLLERVLRGGYPEALARASFQRRTTWARQYLNAMIQRDVRDVAGIDKLDQLPRFLSALAQTAGQMCNYAKLGAAVGLDGKTAARYVGILEQMYLLQRVEVWARNRLKRIVKTPKLQFIDSGLLSVLLGANADTLQRDRAQFGNLLETFVYAELLKQTNTSEGNYRVMYYRDADQFEVDVVIENDAGLLVGVEVKAAATVTERDLKGLKIWSALATDAFKMGILLYNGRETLPLGNGIWAVPLATLWDI